MSSGANHISPILLQSWHFERMLVKWESARSRTTGTHLIARPSPPTRRTRGQKGAWKVFQLRNEGSPTALTLPAQWPQQVQHCLSLMQCRSDDSATHDRDGMSVRESCDVKYHGGTESITTPVAARAWHQQVAIRIPTKAEISAGLRDEETHTLLGDRMQASDANAMLTTQPQQGLSPSRRDPQALERSKRTTTTSAPPQARP